MLASELEARIEPDEVRQAEALVRKQREEAEASKNSSRPRNVGGRLALEAARNGPPTQFLMAVNLERSGRSPVPSSSTARSSARPPTPSRGSIGPREDRHAPRSARNTP